MALVLPPPNVGCRFTGFEKKCCELVATGQCNRWIDLTFKVGSQDSTHWGCIEDQMFALAQMQLNVTDIQTQSIDKGRKEARDRDAAVMAVNAKLVSGVLDAAQRVEAVSQAIEQVSVDELKAITFQPSNGSEQ